MKKDRQLMERLAEIKQRQKDKEGQTGKAQRTLEGMKKDKQLMERLAKIKQQQKDKEGQTGTRQFNTT